MRTISPKELSARIEQGDAPFLLDVREPAEHDAYNIGGQLLPLGNISSMQIDEIEHLKEKEIVVYCRSGMRSMQACLLLETAGFRNLSNLTGGMLAWADMEKGA